MEYLLISSWSETPNSFLGSQEHHDGFSAGTSSRTRLLALQRCMKDAWMTLSSLSPWLRHSSLHLLGWRVKNKCSLYWSPLKSCLWRQGLQHKELSDAPFQLSISCPFLCLPLPLWGTYSLHIPSQSTHCLHWEPSRSKSNVSFPWGRERPTHNSCWESGSPATSSTAEQPQLHVFPCNWYFLCYMDQKIPANKIMMHLWNHPWREHLNLCAKTPDPNETWVKSPPHRQMPSATLSQAIIRILQFCAMSRHSITKLLWCTCYLWPYYRGV